MRRCCRDTGPRRGITLALVLLALVSCGESDGPSNPTPTNPNPGPNPSPTAAFGPSCRMMGCTFADSSTDDQAVTAWRWNFGDGSNASAEQNPVHNYAKEGQYRVALRVTDNKGATDSVFRDIAVSPSSACFDAKTPSDYVLCMVLIPNGDSVTVTISSESDCTANGDTLRIMMLVNSDVFTDGCHAEREAPYHVIDGNPFLAGPTALYLAITMESDDPKRIAPSVHQEGGYPQWTIRLEDGGHPRDLNEPDFNDLVLTITADPQFTPPHPNPWDY